jgi:hypothetical protein
VVADRTSRWPLRFFTGTEPVYEGSISSIVTSESFETIDTLSCARGGDMTSGHITIREFTADDTMTWRTIRLAALANASIAFGQTLEDAEKQAIEDYRKTVSGPFPPFAAFDGALATRAVPEPLHLELRK